VKQRYLPLVAALASLLSGAAYAAPDDAEAAYRAARRAYEREEPEAEDQLRRVLELDSDHGGAHLLLGDLCLEASDLDGAAEHAERAVELLAEHPMSHELLGLVRLDQDDVAGAEASFRRALELDEDSVPAHLGLGRAAEARGDLSAAREAYLEAARRDRRDTEPLFRLGLLLLDQEDYVGAEEVLGRAARLDSRDVAVGTELAYALWAQGKLEQAAREYRRLVRAEQSPSLLYNLGLVEYERGELATAVDALQRSVQQDPSLVDAWELLAMIHGERGDARLSELCADRAAQARGETD
jgi:tetratricopeptide (TPR) repeat protein